MVNDILNQNYFFLKIITDNSLHSAKNRGIRECRCGIATTRNCTYLLKILLNIFECIKLKLFSYNFPFFVCFVPLVDIIGIKPAPDDHESNFKKVGAIPSDIWEGRTCANLVRARQIQV